MKLPALGGELLLCRGCLGLLDAEAEAGLCGRCWSGLLPLPELRCPRCALEHGEGEDCPEPVAWERGDALWDYHGGRPALGALLLPGIKQGERGWLRALLGRADSAPLPEWTAEAELVIPAPTTILRRWRRGFDVADAFAELLSRRLDRPVARVLRKAWRAPSQTGRTETERRRLPRKAVTLADPASVQDRSILLVDDVWTTGTTLLRSAQALQSAGASKVCVVTLFRST
ncbi:MAG TPA: phosphoribosyltransferase family protein [Holophagaceae bacterium]|nr:phosphoribosyltransferase family protein [Holophagaceae bacterium]